MNEQDVRALVREAIERHLGRPEPREGVRGRGQGDSPREAYRPSLTAQPLQSQSHPSHILLAVSAGSDVDDGMCVIEPQVRCNHCGYCQSFGH